LVNDRSNKKVMAEKIYEAGEEVIVVKKKNGHEFKIGSKVVIRKINSHGFVCENEDTKDQWALTDVEIDKLQK
jgi:hypothetical protein